MKWPLFDAGPADRPTSIGLLILRLGVGGSLLTHGWGKVQMVQAGQYELMGDPIGLGPVLSLILVAFAEFCCAILVMLGFATRLAPVPIIVAMSVAAFVVHGSDPWTMAEGARRFMAGEAESWASRQPALLYLIPFLALVFTGAGKYSIDALIQARSSRRAR